MTDHMETFRSETRAWLEANCPETMRTPLSGEEDYVWGGKTFKFKHPDQKLWLDRMAEKGWTAPMWPKAYGGGGLSNAENAVLAQEMKRINARPPLFSFGLWMLGPVLLEYASEEQKLEHLPKIVRGEIRWCQGYSEPGAGSDLAGLMTKCEDKGDHWLINGQKIWTSYANEADWCFCLVRTDTSVKHEGISFVLIDMQTPGVETRPIKLISGSSPFCETFFTDVKIPKDAMVGRLNGGWEIAKRLLQYERTNISGFGSGAKRDVVDIAKANVGLENGVLADGDLRARIAAHKMTERAYALSVARAQEDAKAGQNVSHMASMFKVAGATLNIDRCELMLEAAGSRAFGWSGEGFSAEELGVTRGWLRSKGNSIEGGTTEVNLNVVAKRILGLRDTQ
ncbi:MAG TPA: acyl-CoA dehydrogenase family protein [Terricaulis sp.]|nr:acyl-CoA dehydrogenase family protein [Terricaulis sp.]